MEYNATGRLVKGIGGLYYVLIDKSLPSPMAGKTLPCRARGKFRHDRISPLVGDRVSVVFGERALHAEEAADDREPDCRIEGILDRKNSLIRPPLANLDTLFVAMASASPAPLLSTVDKLIFIAEHNGIEPIIIIGKNDLDNALSATLFDTYQKAGFRVFSVSAMTGEGVDALSDYIKSELAGKIAAFSGASGVGKSSLLNRLFPHLSLATGEVSKKIERGKNTTRHVELFAFPCHKGEGYLADTPGFSMLDFAHFDFFGKEELPSTLREFRPYLGQCRYKKCTHTGEQGCAICRALAEGDIAPSRYNSFLEVYGVLKNKKDWEQK